MTFYKLEHTTEESKRRIDDIIASLSGDSIPQHLAVVIRVTAMKPPYEKYSFLGVGLVERSRYKLSSSKEVYITPRASAFISHFVQEVPSGPLRSKLRSQRLFKSNVVSADLSSSLLPVFGTDTSIENEGETNWVYTNETLVSFPRHRAYLGLEYQQIGEEEFTAYCKELLDRIYEVGHGEASYPVERGVIIWKKGKITQRYSLSDDAKYTRGVKTEVPESGNLNKIQNRLIEYLRSLPASLDDNIIITFKNGMPLKFELTGTIHKRT